MTISFSRKTKIKRTGAAMAAFIAGGLVVSSSASAADRPVPAATPVPEAWIVTLGVEGRIVPTFIGADTYTVLPAPVFSFRRAGTPESFRSFRDNIGFALYDVGPLKLGPVGKVRFRRKESDSSALTGLGNVPWGVEIGGFAEYWATPWLRGRVEVRQGFNAHTGVVADLNADLVVPVAAGLTWSAGPRLTLATAKAIDPYFAVDTAQSLASGLPVYATKGGVQAVGAGTQLRYFWTEGFATHAFVEYDRLLGSTAGSPLVAQRGSVDQVTVGVGLTQAFIVPRFW